MAKQVLLVITSRSGDVRSAAAMARESGGVVRMVPDGGGAGDIATAGRGRRGRPPPRVDGAARVPLRPIRERAIYRVGGGGGGPGGGGGVLGGTAAGGGGGGGGGGAV
jgi:hypothetical protein